MNNFGENIQGLQTAHLACLAKDDGYIINALLKCSTCPFTDKLPSPDWPVIFSLVWGDTMATHNPEFPKALQNIVIDILAEDKKRQEVYNPQEKRIHSIIIELLYFMYEIQVESLVERLKENAKREG